MHIYRFSIDFYIDVEPCYYMFWCHATGGSLVSNKGLSEWLKN